MGRKYIITPLAGVLTARQAIIVTHPACGQTINIIHAAFIYNINVERLSVVDMKQYRDFVEKIRWDLTPEKILGPSFPATGSKSPAATGREESYMFYVDFVLDRPALFIMKNQFHMSMTVGYIEEAPQEMLDAAVKSAGEGHLDSMYPITAEIEEWLRRQLELP